MTKNNKTTPDSQDVYPGAPKITLLHKHLMAKLIRRKYRFGAIVSIAAELIDHRNSSSGQCDPGYGRIAKNLRIKDALTILRNVAALKRDGFLFVMRRKIGEKLNATNLYDFNWLLLYADPDAAADLRKQEEKSGEVDQLRLRYERRKVPAGQSVPTDCAISGVPTDKLVPTDSSISTPIDSVVSTGTGCRVSENLEPNGESETGNGIHESKPIYSEGEKNNEDFYLEGPPTFTAEYLNWVEEELKRAPDLTEAELDAAHAYAAAVAGMDDATVAADTTSAPTSPPPTEPEPTEPEPSNDEPIAFQGKVFTVTEAELADYIARLPGIIDLQQTLESADRFFQNKKLKQDDKRAKLFNYLLRAHKEDSRSQELHDLNKEHLQLKVDAEKRKKDKETYGQDHW